MRWNVKGPRNPGTVRLSVGWGRGTWLWESWKHPRSKSITRKKLSPSQNTTAVRFPYFTAISPNDTSSPPSTFTLEKIRDRIRALYLFDQKDQEAEVTLVMRRRGYVQTRELCCSSSQFGHRTDLRLMRIPYGASGIQPSAGVPVDRVLPRLREERTQAVLMNRPNAWFVVRFIHSIISLMTFRCDLDDPSQ